MQNTASGIADGGPPTTTCPPVFANSVRARIRDVEGHHRRPLPRVRKQLSSSSFSSLPFVAAVSRQWCPCSRSLPPFVSPPEHACARPAATRAALSV